MTTQIVLINQSGLAVASDTMTTFVLGDDSVKTFPTANKIYDLRGNHKVVVLHNGTAALGGLQYELLIREWALQLQEPLPFLDDYPVAFEKWLANYSALRIDEDATVYSILCRALTDALDEIGPDVMAGIQKDQISAESAALLSSNLRQYADAYFKDDSPYEDLSEDDLLQYVRGMKSSITEHLLEHLAIALRCDAVMWSASTEITEAAEYFAVQRLRFWCPGPNRASLVFAGFGSEEPIGGVIDVQVDSFHVGRLRTRTVPRGPKAGTAEEWVATFAQDEAMADFIAGLSWSRLETLSHLAVESLKAIPEQSFAEVAIEGFRGRFTDSAHEMLFDEYTGPFKKAMRALSLPNLVQLCEALVKIQALRSVTARQEATVGGRIESLCISRAEGVHWHLRYDEDRIENANPVHPLI